MHFTPLPELSRAYPGSSPRALPELSRFHERCLPHAKLLSSSKSFQLVALCPLRITFQNDDAAWVTFVSMLRQHLPFVGLVGLLQDYGTCMCFWRNCHFLHVTYAPSIFTRSCGSARIWSFTTSVLASLTASLDLLNPNLPSSLTSSIASLTRLTN